jgi:hypothetical protein
VRKIKPQKKTGADVPVYLADRAGVTPIRPQAKKSQIFGIRLTHR